MDTLFNAEHMRYIGTHRCHKPNKIVLAKEHAKYHTWHIVGVTMGGLGPIGLWELIIKPILMVSHAYPEV